MSRRFTLFLILLVAGLPVLAKHAAIERAEEAVESGEIDLESDIRPLVQALAESRDPDERRSLVGAIDDLAETDSDSPNAVKQFLLVEATPVLFDVIENGNDPFLQGDAVFALRSMPLPRSTLEKAASLAEADPNDYVQSRGEILRGFIRSMPIEDASKTRREVDPEKSREAMAYLDKRGITICTDALREAAGRADPEAVGALLDAGIAPDTGVKTLGDTPLYAAIFGACSSQGAETDWLVETVRLLVDAGASLNLEDDVQNTLMTHAANQCGPRIIGILADGGAKIDRRNKSGLSPLGMALIMQKLENAEALIDHGARLSSQELEMLRASATDGRAKELIRKASGG